MLRFIVSAVAATLMAASAGAATIDFNSPVSTGDSQAAGVWYTDRYAPSGFETTLFDGDQRLKHSIAATDCETCRPGGFSSAFYNTQGRKFDLDSGATSLRVDLWLDDSWTDTGRRYAGLWGTAFNATDGVVGYPIIEFGMGGLRFWDTLAGTWSSTLAIDLGQWVSIGFSLVGAEWVYQVNGSSVGTSAASGATVDLGNAILQGHNTRAGVSYDIYWDNLSTDPTNNAVPEPGALALLGLALAAAGVARRRRA